MYRQQQDASAGAGQQHQFSATTTPYGYSPFSTNMPSMMGHTFQNSPQHLSPRLARQAMLNRQGSIDSQTGMRNTSRSPSPRPNSGTPGRTMSFKPTDRSLPLREVSADTISDAYVEFILYCNPNFPLDSDTSTLRTSFQSPPKSDNKDFETYKLFELIQKFESKEIKTWGQLALDLGVEAPDVSKGQSVQKVQQYTVRLKRWMRAMHVDAFFDHLLGKDHVYFTEIPPPNEPYPPGGRDGVVAEEDLAIRALDPSFRPKRGRRRNSDAEQEAEAENASALKRSRLSEDDLNSSSTPMVMMPFSARQETPSDPWAVASAVTPQTFAPWASKRGASQSAMSAAAHPLHFRWQVHSDVQNPATPHPLTAHPTFLANSLDSAFENEPKSAITPSTRKRRKHGPAVSSAWPSSGGPGAKPRGRPPASRSTQDGPFNTFPADPANDKSTEQSFAAPMALMEPMTAHEEQPIVSFEAPPDRQTDGFSRPGRLSLQVPPHTGGPVRLATPPRLLVNGETNDTDERVPEPVNVDSTSHIADEQLRRQKSIQPMQRDIPGFAFEALKRVLASDLLRAEVTGRKHRLTSDEAKRLADAVLERLGVPRKDTEAPRDDIARLTAASWLGVGEQLNVPLGPATGHNKRVAITRFQENEEGYEEIVSADDNPQGSQYREIFDLSWTVSMAGCNGAFELKGLSLNDPPPKAAADIHDQLLDSWHQTAQRIGIQEEEIGRLKREFEQEGNPARYAEHIRNAAGDDTVDWKTKYHAMEFALKMAKGEFTRFRDRAIEKVLDVLI